MIGRAIVSRASRCLLRLDPGRVTAAGTGLAGFPAESPDAPGAGQSFLFFEKEKVTAVKWEGM
jgi:hypothetical protein